MADDPRDHASDPTDPGDPNARPSDLNDPDDPDTARDPGAAHPADRIVALAAVELSRYSELTRRALYDMVVQVFFTPTPEEVAAARADPEDHYVPTYTAEEAGLRVDYVAGRWFAVWRALEAGPELAADQRYRMVRIDVGGASPVGAPAFRDA